MRPFFEEVFRSGVPVLDREIVAESPSEGEGRRVYMASYDPVAAPHGCTEGVGCMVRDVTERRRAAQVLVQAERLEAVGRVAGGVAHEVNNMMTVITGFSEFLESGLPAGDPRASDVAEIRRAADRAAYITRQLLAYSRQQLLRPTALDLNAVLEQAVPLLARLLGSGIDIELRPAAELAGVRADRAQLEQVLVNLALNSWDAMAGRGTFSAETENVTLAPGLRQVPSGPRMPEGRYVRLTVSDSGQGMDAATCARVFEPFFTTKPPGQGSGLGLATVYGIVKQSGGEVAVRRMASRALSTQGYAILEAENGAEALELLGRTATPVDLVLTDVVMPILNGRELGERLGMERPKLRVLFMSGYTDDDVVRRGLLRPGSPFLQKPFVAADLSRKVRELLDRR